MVDLTYLKNLIHVLKDSNCSNFKIDGLELSFTNQPSPLIQPISVVQEVPIKEEELPPDLRADELMKEDAILNWSSPDSHEDLPLTMGES